MELEQFGHNLFYLFRIYLYIYKGDKKNIEWQTIHLSLPIRTSSVSHKGSNRNFPINDMCYYKGSFPFPAKIKLCNYVYKYIFVIHHYLDDKMQNKRLH